MTKNDKKNVIISMIFVLVLILGGLGLAQALINITN